MGPGKHRESNDSDAPFFGQKKEVPHANSLQKKIVIVNEFSEEEDDEDLEAG